MIAAKQPIRGAMASYLQTWTFRFRGKTGRLLRLADCFLRDPNRGLSPSQLGREAGMPIYDAARLLDQTPELFVKLPRRGDGVTRYRLASAAAVQGQDGIAELVRRHTRRENLLFYLLAATAAMLALVVLLAFLPHLA